MPPCWAGDTLNVASRFEALTRHYGAAVAVSGAVVEAVRAAGRGQDGSGTGPFQGDAAR